GCREGLEYVSAGLEPPVAGPGVRAWRGVAAPQEEPGCRPFVRGSADSRQGKAASGASRRDRSDCAIGARRAGEAGGGDDSSPRQIHAAGTFQGVAGQASSTSPVPLSGPSGRHSETGGRIRGGCRSQYEQRRQAAYSGTANPRRPCAGEKSVAAAPSSPVEK